MNMLNNIDINLLTDEQKLEFLISIIPTLKKFKTVSGHEGNAYFIGDDLVVKEYVGNYKNSNLLEEIFDVYCQEIQGFASKGYLVPQVFAWTKVEPKKSFFSSAEKYPKYYILEERIQGRNLYLISLKNCYSLFDEELSLKSFNKVLNKPEINPLLYREMVREYINDYISVNEFIEAMPDSDLDEFVMSVAKMFEEGKYSAPDVHGRNVFMSDKKLKIIDNFLFIKEKHELLSTQSVEDFLITRISILFEPNKTVNSLLDNQIISSSKELSEFESLFGRHSLVAYAALEKLLKSMKRCLNGKDVTNQFVLYRAYNRLARILDYNQASELINIVSEKY